MSKDARGSSETLAVGETLVSSTAGAPVAATRSDGEPSHELPRTVGRFTIEAKLGAGGMGAVLLATDPLLDRKIAVKVLHREDRENARERFVREAQAMAKLSHENVVVVHDVGIDDGRVYIAMELVAGTLTRWQQHRGWREIVEMYLRAGRGLEAAHRAGLVHRDFKPDNVLVDGSKVRVTDFGLVALSDGDPDKAPTVPPELGLSLTRSGALLGTPRYMAPEQHAGGSVDARADQFAFCVALFEALHGIPPFPGATLAEIAANVSAGRPVPPPAGSQVPAPVQAAILRGLAHDREDRFPAMGELLATLEQALSAEPPPRRRTPVLALLAGGLLISVGIAIIVWARRDETPVEAVLPSQTTPSLIRPDDFGDSKARYETASSAYAAGRWDEAAVGFLDAYAAQRLPQLLYNVGASFHMKAKRTHDVDAYRMAIVYYRRYLAEDRAPKDRDTVEASIAALEAEMTRLKASSAGPQP